MNTQIIPRRDKNFGSHNTYKYLEYYFQGKKILLQLNRVINKNYFQKYNIQNMWIHKHYAGVFKTTWILMGGKSGDHVVFLPDMRWNDKILCNATTTSHDVVTFLTNTKTNRLINDKHDKDNIT